MQMDADEFELGGVRYRARRMGAKDQFFVVRKLTPLMGSFIPMIQAVAKQNATGGNMVKALMSMDVAQIMPLAQGIAGLPEADTDEIISRCLSHVQRGSTSPAGTSWAPVWSTSASKPMFEDMDLLTMLSLVVHVVRKDLANFMVALSSSSIAGAGPSQTLSS